MELLRTLPDSKCSFLNPTIALSPTSIIPISKFSLTTPKTHLNSLPKTTITTTTTTPHEPINDIKQTSIPSMADIVAASRAQNLDLRLQTLGPFYRITAKILETQNELGKAEGLIRVWLGGRILHLDSIRLRRETLGMERSIFGIGLFVGAVAIRYGYECGCTTAELLAINDSDLYHTKVLQKDWVRAVHEVTGSTIGDLAHMLVWGGIGTRMDANVEDLLIKWCSRFKSQK
ncbi:hypothetical protein ACOSP7_005023 [Xanthoceras sorbifolium]